MACISKRHFHLRRTHMKIKTKIKAGGRCGPGSNNDI
jgi:hypothetical protein